MTCRARGDLKNPSTAAGVCLKLCLLLVPHGPRQGGPPWGRGRLENHTKPIWSTPLVPRQAGVGWSGGWYPTVSFITPPFVSLHNGNLQSFFVCVFFFVVSIRVRIWGISFGGQLGLLVGPSPQEFGQSRRLILLVRGHTGALTRLRHIRISPTLLPWLCRQCKSP